MAIEVVLMVLANKDPAEEEVDWDLASGILTHVHIHGQ
jgi:hypothetical protein